MRRFSQLAIAGVVLGAAVLLPATPASARGGDEPIPQLLSHSGDGDTSRFIDQGGVEVFAVQDGHDLDHYTFRSGSPIGFAINVDRDYGPVDSIGHPAPGNALFGRHARLTLRAWDVDETYPGSDVEPEVDRVRVNGVELEGILTGANDQWSITTFNVPASVLLLPTVATPEGRNEFEVLIDTANVGGDVWAVEVDWAELRPITDGGVRPLALLHGIHSGQDPEDPLNNDMSEFRLAALDAVPELVERVINPTSGNDDSIEQRSSDLQGPLEELLTSTGAASANIAAHSMGGLVARRYAWDHRGEINSIAMISTPNGGQPLAGFLCAFPGEDPAMCQNTEDYVREVFNKVVLDHEQVTYIARSSIFVGESDGTVPVASAEWLSRTDPDHPGKHFTRPRYALEHAALIAEGSPVFLDVLCEPSFYPGADDCPIETSSLNGLGVAASSQLTVTFVEEVVVPAQGSVSVPLAFEGTAAARILAVMDSPDASVGGTISGEALQATEFFGINALEAVLSAPADDDLVLTNSGGAPVTAKVLVEIETARVLAADVTPSLAAPAQAITVSASLDGWESSDQLTATVIDEQGSPVEVVTLSHVGAGQYSAEIDDLPSGTYSVLTTTSAPTRIDYSLLRVSSGAATFAGGFTEDLTGMGNGLADALVISPAVTVSQAGRYAISARLVDGSGETVATAGTDLDLAVGTQHPELHFDGRAIFDSGRSGPYRLVDAVIAISDPLALEAEASDLGTTASYAFSEFEHFPVAFDLESFTDRGVDTNGDEVFESLEVTFSVSVEAAGSYAVNARLLAPDGTQVTKTQSTPTLAAGSNELKLVFDGEAIAASGLDGPYEIADLSVYPLSNDDHLGYLLSAHTTGPYAAADFDARDVFYLHNNPTPPVGDTTAQADLPLTTAEPTAGVLHNYATNLDSNTGVTGRFIDKTSYGLAELDLQKHQTWLTDPLSSDLTISGEASLSIWARLKSPTKNLQFQAFLSECDATLTCTHFATGDMEVLLGGSSTAFQEVLLTFGEVSATIDAGSHLRLHLVSLNVPGADQSYLAYDTVAYPARLILGE